MAGKISFEDFRAGVAGLTALQQPITETPAQRAAVLALLRRQLAVARRRVPARAQAPSRPAATARASHRRPRRAHAPPQDGEDGGSEPEPSGAAPAAPDGSLSVATGGFRQAGGDLKHVAEPLRRLLARMADEQPENGHAPEGLARVQRELDLDAAWRAARQGP
jgi:hypothetical protein